MIVVGISIATILILILIVVIILKCRGKILVFPFSLPYNKDWKANTSKSQILKKTLIFKIDFIYQIGKIKIIEYNSSTLDNKSTLDSCQAIAGGNVVLGVGECSTYSFPFIGLRVVELGTDDVCDKMLKMMTLSNKISDVSIC